MPSDRDDLDDQLLRQGRYPELLAAYYPIIVARLRMRVPAGVVYDVAHDAVVRLLAELQRGKRYPIPFRAVVHQVTGWTLSDHYVRSKKRPETPLPPDWTGWETYGGTKDGGASGVDFDDWFRYLCECLTPHDQQTALMHFDDDMAIVDIATELGLTRNAIDQALHRIRKTLMEKLNDG